MSIALFAILGASTNAGASYWVCFAFYCAFHVVWAIKETVKEFW